MSNTLHIYGMSSKQIARIQKRTLCESEIVSYYPGEMKLPGEMHTKGFHQRKFRRQNMEKTGRWEHDQETMVTQMFGELHGTYSTVVLTQFRVLSKALKVFKSIKTWSMPNLTICHSPSHSLCPTELTILSNPSTHKFVLAAVSRICHICQNAIWSMARVFKSNPNLSSNVTSSERPAQHLYIMSHTSSTLSL